MNFWHTIYSKRFGLGMRFEIEPAFSVKPIKWVLDIQILHLQMVFTKYYKQ